MKNLRTEKQIMAWQQMVWHITVVIMMGIAAIVFCIGWVLPFEYFIQIQKSASWRHIVL